MKAFKMNDALLSEIKPSRGDNFMIKTHVERPTELIVFGTARIHFDTTTDARYAPIQICFRGPASSCNSATLNILDQGNWVTMIPQLTRSKDDESEVEFVKRFIDLAKKVF